MFGYVKKKKGQSLAPCPFPLVCNCELFFDRNFVVDADNFARIHDVLRIQCFLDSFHHLEFNRVGVFFKKCFTFVANAVFTGETAAEFVDESVDFALDLRKHFFPFFLNLQLFLQPCQPFLQLCSLPFLEDLVLLL